MQDPAIILAPTCSPRVADPYHFETLCVVVVGQRTEIVSYEEDLYTNLESVLSFPSMLITFPFRFRVAPFKSNIGLSTEKEAPGFNDIFASV